MHNELENSPPVTWGYFDILGWRDEDGRLNLTSWDGATPLMNVVVTGLAGRRVPVWNSKIPTGVGLIRIPDGVDPQEFARKQGGINAFGWHLTHKICRE